MPVLSNIVGTPTTPQYCEVVWRGVDSVTGEGNRKFYQIWHFRRISFWTFEAQIEVARAFRTMLNAILAGLLNVDYVGGDISARYMDDPTNNFSGGLTASNGTVSGDRLPNWNAVCMQLKTDGRGRNYRGSKHFGPVAESQTLEEFLTDAAQTAWEAVSEALADGAYSVTTAAGNIWQIIVLSPSLSNLEANPSVFTSADVIGASINHRIGSMLRRKKVGRT